MAEGSVSKDGYRIQICADGDRPEFYQQVKPMT